MLVRKRTGEEYAIFKGSKIGAGFKSWSTPANFTTSSIMKGIIPIITLVLLAATGSKAQECVDGRYYGPLFQDTVIHAIPFGANIGVNGQMQTLYMDVYMPMGDELEARPVVLVAYGGSFVWGQRSDVAWLCKEFARRGYVAVAPDYRIGPFNPNAMSTMLAVMRGTHDLKACIRYLRKSVAEEGDPYRLDVDRISVGGISAGAISALHATYLDQANELPAILEDIASTIGGVEGNSGNPEYASDVIACYSFSGAIGDTAWIQPGDPSLASVHETGDAVVPYFTSEVLAFGIPTGLIGHGSHSIHTHMEVISNDHCLLTYQGDTHVGYLVSDPQTSLGFVFEHCANVVCGEDAYCGLLNVDVAEQVGPAPVSIHPQPAYDSFTFRSPSATTARLYDQQGREVMTWQTQAEEQRVSVEQLSSGTYIIRFDDGAILPRTILITKE